jgi:hypothetical protein
MKKNKIFLSMNFSYPFLIKFYYFYSAIVALKFKLSRKRSRIIDFGVFQSFYELMHTFLFDKKSSSPPFMRM